MAGKRKSKSIPDIIVEPLYILSDEPKKIVEKFAWCARELKKRLSDWTNHDLTGDIYIRSEKEGDLLMKAVYVFLDLCREGYLFNKEFFAEPLRVLVSEVFGDNFEQYLAADFRLSEKILKEKRFFPSISSNGLKALNKMLDKIADDNAQTNPTEQNGGNTSVVNKITISNSQIGSVQAGVNNKSNSNAEQHKNSEEKKSVFWKIILWVAATIAGTIIVDIFGNFGWLKIIHNLLLPK